MVLYVLIFFVLASFVIAFFGARSWHWGHVIVVELLVLSTFGFFLLAAEVVRINAVLRTQINKTQKELDGVVAQNVALKDGTTDGAIIGQLGNVDPPVKTSKDPEGSELLRSLADLDSDLLIQTRVRGRVWRNVKPTGQMNAQTGAVTIAVPAPVPAGMKAQTVVYAFDDGPPQPLAAGAAPRGPQFLGEFNVVQAGPQQATLQPVLPLDQLERGRLVASRGPWVIYESMPLDRHEIFLGKSDQKLKSKLPAKTVEEFIRDKKPATDKDDAARVIGYDGENHLLPPADIAKAATKKYQRRLRDYAAEFDNLMRRRVVMLADSDAIKKDIEHLTTAQDIAKKLQAFREDERRRLGTDLAGINKEHDAIEGLLTQIKKQIARARELTDNLLRANAQMADELKTRSTRPPGSGSTSPANTGPLALEGK